MPEFLLEILLLLHFSQIFSLMGQKLKAIHIFFWKVGVKNWVLTWSKKSGSQLMQMRIFANFAPSFPFKQKFPTGNCMQQTIFWFMSKSIIAFKKSTFKECKEAVDSSSRCKLLPKINFTSKLLFDYHHSIDVCAFFFNHFSWL